MVVHVVVLMVLTPAAFVVEVPVVLVLVLVAVPVVEPLLEPVLVLVVVLVVVRMERLQVLVKTIQQVARLLRMTPTLLWPVEPIELQQLLLLVHTLAWQSLRNAAHQS